MRSAPKKAAFSVFLTEFSSAESREFAFSKAAESFFAPVSRPEICDFWDFGAKNGRF
jgi:hypothetical protein